MDIWFYRAKREYIPYVLRIKFYESSSVAAALGYNGASNVGEQEQMALDLGIVGLQGSGKTTLFNAITGSHVQTSAYSSGDQPNVAVVKVPDSRLQVLADMFHPRKVTPADVQFTDVAGMSASVKERDSKEPISRQTLGFISTVD